MIGPGHQFRISSAIPTACDGAEHIDSGASVIGECEIQTKGMCAKFGVIR